MKRTARRRRTATTDRMIPEISHTRPVAGMMDRLGGLTLDELKTERHRLESARRGIGIGPSDWFRLQAVKALLTRHEVETTRHAAAVWNPEHP